jgi:molybdenum cofactor cytidylyltransferase
VRLLTITAQSKPEALPNDGILSHDVRNPAQRNEVWLRKGSTIGLAQLEPLLERGIGEVHLALPEPGDLAEDEAATRLGQAVAGPGVEYEAAHHGQLTFTSSGRGVLRVDAEVLRLVNDHDDVLLLTGEPDRVVDRGQTLGVIKCAPLFLPSATIEAINSLIATSGPALRVEPFLPRRIGFVGPAERLRGGAFERATDALRAALEWYGSSLEPAVAVDGSRVEDMARAYAGLREAGSDLILAAGASGTDPLDVVFQGLRQAGGEVTQMGIPAEPGTACWIGRLAETPVLGLASCELFGQPGALDLLLPRVLTGEALDRRLVRDLALGGLLNGPARIAPYHTRAGAG